MMTTHPFNALAIGQYTQALNNRLYCYFDGINAIQKVKSFFLVGNNSSFQPKDSISMETQTEASVKVRTKYAVKTVFLMRTNHCMGLNLKCWFCQSIKRRMGKQIPPISGINLKDYFLSNLASFSRQVAITHTKIKNRLHEFQNLGYINLALAKSSVRIGTLFILPATHDALSVFFCVNTCARLFIKSFSMVALVGHPKGWLDSVGASSLNPANVTANEIETSSGDYLNNYLLEAVIMTTTLSSIVSTQKLFKFYDLSTAQVIQTTATTERQARKILGKQSLIFIARIRITPIIERARTWGGYNHE